MLIYINKILVTVETPDECAPVLGGLVMEKDYLVRRNLEQVEFIRVPKRHIGRSITDVLGYNEILVRPLDYEFAK